MKERPIIFCGLMVKAILEGRKTVTRRVMKPQPETNDGVRITGAEVGNDGRICWHWQRESDSGVGSWYWANPCPYGKPGDRLWVRETFFDYGQGVVHYKADEDPEIAAVAAENGLWRPSMFMPRWASRLTLEICSVRVERLQDISEEDAIAEGCAKGDWVTFRGQLGCFGVEVSRGAHNAKEAYRYLWDSINGKREDCSWDADPFVWVLEFRRVSNG